MNTISIKSKYATCILLLVITLFSCQNGKPEFDDFEYTTSYFPWQYPVRTIILGESTNYDNSNDLKHQFLVSAAIGGVYENKEERKVEFIIDPALLDNLYFPDDNPVKVLPKSHYSLSDNSKIIISAGKANGGVMVKLTDAFFHDPLAYKETYVLPLRIISASTDSVLRGKANESAKNPDRRVASDWSISPKDFTVFCVKYINAYHGNYLLRGKAVINDNSGEESKTVTYRADFVEKDIVTAMVTNGLEKLIYKRPVPAVAGSLSPGNYEAQIIIKEDGTCIIESLDNSEYNPFKISGTGKFIKKGDSWGEKQRDVFHLNFQIQTEDKNYQIVDTLVFRDNTITLQEIRYSVK